MSTILTHVAHLGDHSDDHQNFVWEESGDKGGKMLGPFTGGVGAWSMFSFTGGSYMYASSSRTIAPSFHSNILLFLNDRWDLASFHFVLFCMCQQMGTVPSTSDLAGHSTCVIHILSSYFFSGWLLLLGLFRLASFGNSMISHRSPLFLHCRCLHSCFSLLS